MASLSCCCSFTPSSSSSSSPSITQFISDQPYLSLLEKRCTTMSDLQNIHAPLIKTGLIKDKIAASRVLAFCASPAGNMSYAFMVFKQIRDPNHFIWNTIIRGFAHSSTPQMAVSLFLEMLLTSSFDPQILTYPSVFKAYARLGQAYFGAQLHGRIAKLGLGSDRYIRNTIIHMYAVCGFLSEAWKLFDESSELDVVSWNSMIMGLSKCGEVDEAVRLFNKMPLRNPISWNTIISGYVRNGRLIEALELFGKMQQERIKPSEYTMVSLLNASGRLGAIRQGKWIHDYIMKNEIELNVIVVTAIIDMYCKCGCISEALHVFETAPKLGLSSWNSMIMGLALNGWVEEAIELFSKFESSNLEPDDVSFLAVLMACTHSGMVDKATDLFSLMIDKYKIEPSIRHYSCMVDVLGQAGFVEEAENVILSMPIKADAIIWGSLLAACRKHGNIEMAQRAAEQVIELDPSESSAYVLMSNLYAGSSQFEEAIEQRLNMKEKMVEKEPGCSLIEVDGQVHEFVAFGRTHPRAKEIYSLLN
ncbi:hypothetical protein CsatB_021478 [Cannabis sativa]